MDRFAFILGHVPVLSSIEAKKVFPDLEIEDVVGNVLIGSCSLLNSGDGMNRIGGIVKIARFAKSVLRERIEEECCSLLASLVPEGRITFGISWYGNLARSDSLAMNIKSRMKALGRSVRCVRGKAAVLNGVELAFNEFGKPSRVEFCLLPSGGRGEVDMFTTVAFQDVGSFVKLENALSARDDRSGVVPLRLANILVNISGVKPNNVFCDPFCGSGILVSVAALLGAQNILASDSSPKAVLDTKHNLSNIGSVFGLSGNWIVNQCDVRALSKCHKPGSIDTIVTEPYLGPQTRAAHPNEHKRLSELYHAAFKEFRNVVKPGGFVLFIFPVINDVHDFDDVQKLIRGMGFKKIDLMEGIREWFPNDVEPVYSRPHQRVRRLITMWKRV